ncbi:MAG: aspartate--tRNA(Asn) ligase [Spirochaetaceae bacterium]|nr:MAG: aspartate--tRNA(Asn) ligase [Spirochaetaceae bacterium]
MRVLLAQINDHLGKEIQVQGWVHRIRELGKISFILLRDVSGMAQLVVAAGSGSEQVAQTASQLTLESVVSVRGMVTENQKAPGGFEVQVAKLEVIARAEPDLPLAVNQDPDKVSLDAILEYRMISLRNPKILSVFRLQSAILKLFAEHMRGEGFTEIKTSKLIGTGTEGGTGLFAVEYFDTKVFLAQSPQFYKQAMVSSGLERVFEIGCAYRAEKHETPRHLNEYVSLDVETAWIQSEQDLMDLEVRILKTIFEGLKRENADVLEIWQATVPSAEEVEKIPRVSHDQAKDTISTIGGKKVFEINPEGERVLCDWALKEHGVEAVFIFGWPRKKRPFYTYPLDVRSTMSFDLLFRGLEVTTGGRRINEYSMLLENIELFGLDPGSLNDYIHIFKYGCPPHGGFAIGLERLTQKILGLANVKEASLFPRDRRRIRP